MSSEGKDSCAIYMGDTLIVTWNSLRLFKVKGKNRYE